ncbi:MAG: FHA domain-containing protein, partial [Planctomycetota bacterium]
MARLILQHQGHKSEYPISGDMMIGRQATNDIVVLAEKASRQHAKIIAKGGKYAVEDLKSANGTLVNGKKIKLHRLKHGDEISIGEAVLTFHDKRAASLEGQSLSNYRIHNKIGEGAMGTV